jgi:hypothetical protein
MARVMILGPVNRRGRVNVVITSDGFDKCRDMCRATVPGSDEGCHS